MRLLLIHSQGDPDFTVTLLGFSLSSWGSQDTDKALLSFMIMLPKKQNQRN